MCKKLALLISFVLIVCLVSNPLVHAATRTWDNEGGDNRWDNAVNWSNDKVPKGGDTARIVMTGADEAQIDGAVETEINKIQVGWLVSGEALAGDLRMIAGVLSLTQASQVGRKSTGALYVEGGTLNTRVLDIGDDAGGVGTFTMSDGTVNLGNTDVDWKTLHIGRDSATGSASISGGNLSAGTINVGNQLDSVGSFVMSGGTVSTGAIGNTNAFNVANNGATGTATILDGIINISGHLNVGNGRKTVDEVVTPSNGLLDMQGGTINIGFSDTALDWRNLRIGHNEGVGVMNMSGGTINVNGGIIVGSTNIQIIEEPYEEIPHPGSGTLTMTGGLISAADANSLDIGVLDSTGWVDLLGGIIMAGDLVIENGGLNITEGMLILAGDKMQTVLDYIDAGLLTAYGGASYADWQYDYNVRNDFRTTVTAIPEPATVALLSLGALVILRRRKK
jgi:hypothetical protein